MKNVFLILMVMFLMSCGASKKTVMTNEMKLDSLTVVNTASGQTEKYIDVTSVEKGKITVTEIEFFEPQNVTDNKVQNKQENHTYPTTNEQLNMKSIKHTVIETNTEEKEESKEVVRMDEIGNVTAVEKMKEETDEYKEPAPDPYRWRYIFFILLIVIGVFLYVRKIPLVKNIVKIFTNLISK